MLRHFSHFPLKFARKSADFAHFPGKTKRPVGRFC
ncbi:hypothetical protein KP1_1268 [Klebsiella pneumoniae subsp. pneumoniae NTUH-K2044]|nr:hypothetical protein KP1_1268 [Klebsiella pneumoniae subsp. pneumoniae NTUH-K2044]